MRETMQFLAQAPREREESTFAAMVERAMSGTEHERDIFLVSNELWGGAGSIADQAGMHSPRTDGRRQIERALIQPGNRQIRERKVNPRTAMWVAAFEERETSSA